MRGSNVSSGRPAPPAVLRTVDINLLQLFDRIHRTRNLTAAGVGCVLNSRYEHS